MTPLSILLGFVLSLVIAALAYRRGSLKLSGAIGAVLIGSVVFAGGGLTWGLVLIAFFVTSSALSHWQARVKEPLAEKFQKGTRRDIGQVLANGGWGALIALAYALDPQPLWFVAYVGAMATVNADTWATELGVLSREPPKLVTTGRLVAVGTSGGVTPLGVLAAFGGACLIGALAFGLSWLDPWAPSRPASSSNLIFLIPVAAFAGMLGSLFDSLLGATVQAIYYCDADQKETESPVHRCGRPTRRIRGWAWLDNDWVNLLASILGSGAAVAVWSAFR